MNKYIKILCIIVISILSLSLIQYIVSRIFKSKKCYMKKPADYETDSQED